MGRAFCITLQRTKTLNILMLNIKSTLKHLSNCCLPKTNSVITTVSEEVIESEVTVVPKKTKPVIIRSSFHLIIYQKVWATHFLSLRITNPTTLRRIQSIQDSIRTNYPHASRCLIPPEKLHITLFALAINDDSTLQQVCEAFRVLPPVLAKALTNVTCSDVTINNC
jgi:hypothetical protein